MKNIFQTLILLVGTSFLVLSCGGGSSEKKADASAETAYKLGFIPLTDCAPLVIAKEKGFFEKAGVKVELSKEASWANVRDKVLNVNSTGLIAYSVCLFRFTLASVVKRVKK